MATVLTPLLRQVQACAHRAEGGLSAYLLPDGFCVGPVQVGQVRVLRSHGEFDTAMVLDTRANVRTPALPPTMLGGSAWRSIKVTGLSWGVVSLCGAPPPPRLHRRGRLPLQHRVL